MTSKLTVATKYELSQKNIGHKHKHHNVLKKPVQIRNAVEIKNGYSGSPSSNEIKEKSSLLLM